MGRLKLRISLQKRKTINQVRNFSGRWCLSWPDIGNVLQRNDAHSVTSPNSSWISASSAFSSASISASGLGGSYT